MSRPKTIVVCGGTGFLGSRICHSAALRNWTVISLSRSGTPTWDSISGSATPPAWADKIQWRKADLLSPETYKVHLKGADAVVHSMGILLEADYKGVISGKEGPVALLRRLLGRGANPLDEGEGGDGDGAKQLTYESMNRDSAVNLAREAAAQNVPAFVYISAAAGAPVLPARYINSKRDAESAIASQFPRMRSVFMRPGFLYDASRAFTVPFAYATFPFSTLNTMLGGMLTPILGAGVEKPLKADLVAEAVVEAIEDAGVKGPIVVSGIEELATKAWRRNML